MSTYFLRRILLMIPTFIGITFVCYSIMRFVPGGPVEQAIMKIQMGGAASAGSEVGGGADAQTEISEEMVEELKKIYGFDKPLPVAYANWLWNVLQFDLGSSYDYDDPVWDLIYERFPVSLFFGGIGFVLSYLICIPLGIFKAMRHGGMFDWTSSVIVFVGYAIPGFAMGIVLLVLLGGGSYWDVFPLGGLQSEGYENFSTWEKIQDRFHHAVLPVFCYMIGSFASTTVLMKNSLMENLGQDYVRTAFAKGLEERVVVFKHVFRNSLIPIATGAAHFLSILLAGSYLIERVFDIHGVGLLGFKALVSRDYPVTLGVIVIGSVLTLIGNLIADFLYAAIDPRIRFE